MKRTRRRLAGLLFGFVMLGVLGTFVPRPLLGNAEQAPLVRRILVLSNPIHTDIAVPIDAELAARFAFLVPAGVPVDDPDARWLIFGWGGRAFYLSTPTWSDLKPVPLLKGLTLDASVLHVQAYGTLQEPHPAIAGFRISDAGYDRLLDYIEASFTASGGAPLPIANSGYGDDDAFFEAEGSFSALLGCNTWTAGGLRAAGLRTGWWNPMPLSLATSTGLFNAPRQSGPAGFQP